MDRAEPDRNIRTDRNQAGSFRQSRTGCGQKRYTGTGQGYMDTPEPDTNIQAE